MYKLISLIFISFLTFGITGCDDQAQQANEYGNSIGDASGGTNNLDSLNSGNALAEMGNDGSLDIQTDGFGGGMGGMGDIDALMNGKKGPPKKYAPRFTMMGEVNATIDGKFYRFASVYDNQQEVPMSKFMYDAPRQRFIVQIVGVQVWNDKLVSNKRIIIKFPLTPLGKEPFMQESTIAYPTNVQSMVKAGGKPYYWGYLMGGGGYWVTMDGNNTQHMTQFAFGAFVMPSKN